MPPDTSTAGQNDSVKTPIRTIRIGGIWDEAQTVAGVQGDNVPDIVRLALRAYVADPTATIVALAQIRGGAL
jgi:hypothetical protein